MWVYFEKVIYYFRIRFTKFYDMHDVSIKSNFVANVLLNIYLTSKFIQHDMYWRAHLNILFVMILLHLIFKCPIKPQ